MDDLLNKIDELISEVKLIRIQVEPTREIMSVDQAAEHLGQSIYTIREWIRLRKIPYSKINGSIKFRKSKIDRWIDRHEVMSSE